MDRLITIFSLFLFFSCSGYVDPSDSDAVPEGVLRIFADKTEIAADGQEKVTFTVKYGSQDVSTDPNMNLIRILDGQEQTLKPGLNEFSTTTPAKYRFKARYFSGAASYTDNEVVVLAKSVGESVGQKDYYRKAWGMQFTAVSCTYCPELTASLKAVTGAYPDRIVLTAFHVMFDESTLPDPMRLNINEDFRDHLKQSDGLPLFAFNMVKDKDAIVDQQNLIESALNSYGESATCGVAISTTYDESKGALTVQGRVTSNLSQAVRYHMILVEDKIEYAQAGADNGYIHNYVVRDVLADNIWGDRLNQGQPLEVGVEVTVSRTMQIQQGWNHENMRVVFAVLTPAGDQYVCGNINECTLGASVDYIYNEK